MTIEEIKELIELFHQSGVAELEVQRGDNRVRLRRASEREETYVLPAANPAPAGQHVVGLSGSAAAPAKELDVNNVLVKSPIVGTYYDQASPGTPPFIKVGDSVEPGQVLCIIESMKLMNEIEAETAGIVAAKLVENGKPVEYGEALFAIRPR